jgi:hypothetical protein
VIEPRCDITKLPYRNTVVDTLQHSTQIYRTDSVTEGSEDRRKSKQKREITLSLLPTMDTEEKKTTKAQHVTPSRKIEFGKAPVYLYFQPQSQSVARK